MVMHNKTMNVLKKMILKISAKQRGFTLIELLVVIAIIGVLSALLMTNFVGIRQRARDGQRKSDLRQIQSAVELYRADNAEYPAEAAFSTCGATSLVSGSTTYMKKIPCDPLTNAPYYYEGTSTNYCLRSCLENENDAQISSGSGSCSGLPACVSPLVNFTVENP